MNAFAPHAGRAYQHGRNTDPGPEGKRANSHLSPWLSHRLIGEEEVLRCVLARHPRGDAYKFVSEMLWRVYFQGHLEWQPSVWRAYIEDRNAALARLDEDAEARAVYDRAVTGDTGIEAFDCWANELVETGFLHNHTRMWFSSIWIFTLGLDWTLGADFFLRHLLDGDAASNTCNWRWTAGLHSKGKTYLATKANIRRYTDGRFAPDGLAAKAEALTEARDHPRSPPNLPATCGGGDIGDKPFALLVHEQDCMPETLDLGGRTPGLLIGVERAASRSPLPVTDAVAQFSSGAVEDGLNRGHDLFGSPQVMWTGNRRLADVMDEAGLDTIVVPYLGEGWLRDEIRDELNAFAADHRCVRVVRDIDRVVWPLSKAGYFGVRKKLDDILDTLGLDGDVALEPSFC